MSMQTDRGDSSECDPLLAVNLFMALPPDTVVSKVFALPLARHVKSWYLSSPWRVLGRSLRGRRMTTQDKEMGGRGEAKTKCKDLLFMDHSKLLVISDNKLASLVAYS